MYIITDAYPDMKSMFIHCFLKNMLKRFKDFYWHAYTYCENVAPYSCMIFEEYVNK